MARSMKLDATEMAGSRTQDGTLIEASIIPMGLIEGVEAAMQQGRSGDGLLEIQLQDDKLFVVLGNLWDVAFRRPFLLFPPV